MDLKPLLGFFLEHTKQSSARATGIALIAAACLVAMAAVVWAFLHWKQANLAPTLTAFAAIVAALGGSGWGAIASRSRTGGDPG